MYGMQIIAGKLPNSRASMHSDLAMDEARGERISEISTFYTIFLRPIHLNFMKFR